MLYVFKRQHQNKNNNQTSMLSIPALRETLLDYEGETAGSIQSLPSGAPASEGPEVSGQFQHDFVG